MIIRKLELKDTDKFCGLIKNMYANLENLEWFSPMPFDTENVRRMIESPRLFIIGAFEGDDLCGVSSFDYKCGKLIGKVDFPKDCNTDKLVEIGFNIVDTRYRGHGIMKSLVEYLLSEAKAQGFEWVFAKVHKDNFASSKSFLKNGFYKHIDLEKPIKIRDINGLLADGVLSDVATTKIKDRLKSANIDDEVITTNYEIFIKKI